MTPVARILAALRDHEYQPKRAGNAWACRCPAHDDQTPSLSIAEGDDGRALVRIHRAAVLALLVDGYGPSGDTDAGYVLGERLGVADGLGLPIAPGSAAWLVAVGESMAAGP